MAADLAGAVSSWRGAREAAININTAAPPTRWKPDTQTKLRSPREPHLFGFMVKIIQHECNKSSRAEPPRPPSSSSPLKSNSASWSAARLLSSAEIFQPFNAKTVSDVTKGTDTTVEWPHTPAKRWLRPLTPPLLAVGCKQRATFFFSLMSSGQSVWNGNRYIFRICGRVED